jgi:hypothetical protein
MAKKSVPRVIPHILKGKGIAQESESLPMEKRKKKYNGGFVKIAYAPSLLSGSIIANIKGLLFSKLLNFTLIPRLPTER